MKLIYIFFFKILFNIFVFKKINPKISIIVPIYNVNFYLTECLDSIINQTLKEIEIICINDGSTDNSLEIIEKYKFDNRIIIIDKKNTGYGDSMNEGLEFSSGEYVGIVESDDFIDLNMYKILYNYSKIGDIDIIRTNYYLYWEKNKKINLNFNLLSPVYNKIFNPIDFPNIFFIRSSIWAGIYKKDLIINNNIKFLTTPGASYQDTSFFYKTLFKSKYIFYINNYLYYYRQTNINSSVLNNSLNKVLFIHKEFDEVEKYFKKDLNLFYKIDKYIYTKKIKAFLWNLKRVDKKKDYFKYIYKDAFKIIKNNNYFHYIFNNFENRLFTYLIDYGDIVSSDIYLNTISYNITKPIISIIISVYNSDNFIEECLNNLINQTFKNFEIICVNYVSNINTLKILKKYENKDNRIHIITWNKEEEKNKNIQIKKSKGEYLIFLDSDDIFEKTMLEEFYAKIKGNNVDVVICNSTNFKIKKNNIILYYNLNYKKYYDILKNKSFSSFDIKTDFLNIFIPGISNKIFKKKFIEKFGINFLNINSTEDLLFISSLIIASKNISFLDKILINHRLKEHENKYKFLDNFYNYIRKLKKFIKEKNLYKRFKQDFINFVTSFSIFKLEQLNGKAFCDLYLKLKYELWIELGINKYNKNYFYNENIYKKLKCIIESDLNHFEIIKKKYDNNIKIDYLKNQKFSCFKLYMPNYIIKNNIKLKILYFLFMKLKIKFKYLLF